MLHRNKLFLLGALLVALAALLSAQSSSPQSSANPQQQDKTANGPVQDVIPPLPDNQQPGTQPPGTQPVGAQQPGTQPSGGQQGGSSNGPVPDVIPPLPDNQQPPNASQGAPPPPAQQPPPPNQPQSAPGQVEETGGGGYVIRKQVQEVMLHATVIDDHQRLVTNLDRTAFTVFEDGRPQQITSFRHEDIPVSLGIVIDNSGSMRDKRPSVNQAAINLVKASNPNDEVFVVNFNDEYFLDQDFTSSLPQLQEALERIEARGGTALYDAIVASGEHLKKTAKLEKKVLLVVTDGEDNASRESLEQAIRRLAAENGPTVYTIGILGSDSHQRRAKRALSEIAEQTGGVAFFPRDLSEVDAISRAVAHDIRNQYTIGYKPTNPQTRGGYRTVKVEARAHGYARLQVRTRSGYYAGQERAAK